MEHARVIPREFGPSDEVFIVRVISSRAGFHLERSLYDPLKRSGGDFKRDFLWHEKYQILFFKRVERTFDFMRAAMIVETYS